MKKRILFFVSLAILCYDSPLCACGFSHTTDLMPLLWLGALIFIVSLVIYIAYVYYSYKLFRETKAQKVSTGNTRTIAILLATINTSVFLSVVSLVFVNSFELFLVDLFAWGIPFYFFINGIKSRTGHDATLDESKSLDS